MVDVDWVRADHSLKAWKYTVFQSLVVVDLIHLHCFLHSENIFTFLYILVPLVKVCWAISYIGLLGLTGLHWPKNTDTDV